MASSTPNNFIQMNDTLLVKMSTRFQIFTLAGFSPSIHSFINSGKEIGGYNSADKTNCHSFCIMGLDSKEIS